MNLRDERGDATLELALVAPLLMLLIVGVLQFGLLHHAHQVVQAAAAEAARRAAAEGATPADGEARALTLLRAGLGRAAEHPVVRVEVGTEEARVEVEAEMRGLLPIPGLSSFALQSEGRSYVERFRPAGGDP